VSILLQAHDLRFAYPAAPSSACHNFLFSVDLIEVRAGEVHALVGPNGCGKSTLLRLMAGILQPSAGIIRLEDQILHKLSRIEIAHQVSFLPQQVISLFPVTVLEMVLMGRHPLNRGLGLPSLRDLHAVESTLQRMGVEMLRDRDFNSLSGGERQRVLLAAALAQEPRVILLDEPTNALDIHHQVEVLHLLHVEARRGAGILMVTHDLTMAGHFADKITLMQSGRMISTGAVQEVLTEDQVRRLYGQHLRLMKNPESGLPLVVPVRTPSSKSPVSEKSATKPPIPSPLAMNIGVTNSDLRREHGEWLGEVQQPLSLRRYLCHLALFAVLCVVAFVGVLWFGSEKIDVLHSLHEIVFSPAESWSVSTQILAIRIPRVAMGLLAGIALSGVGAAFQSMLRNPLAEPYTLGIATSASLGAVLVLSFPVFSFQLGPVSGVQTSAFAFSIASVWILWRVTQRSPFGRNLVDLLLAGITLGLIGSAFIMLVRFMANPLTARAMDQWMVGGIEVTGWRDPLSCLVFFIPGVLLLLLSSRDLSQIELGEDLALSRGVEVEQVQRRVFVGGSLATAAVVAVTGPVGFVGLIIPHLVRRLVGSDLRLVLPCSMLVGGTLLMCADAGARSWSVGGRGSELPVGILTSLIGGPVFLFLLFRIGKGKQGASIFP